MNAVSDAGTNEVRIVVLGQIGGGKSSTANTIFGENVFIKVTSPSRGTNLSTCFTKLINERDLTIVDTPGFSHSELTDETVHNEIKESVMKCKPGPHAFVLILRVGVYAAQNVDSLSEFKRLFGVDALKYAVICFTHGDDLNDGQTIEDFLGENAELKRLVNECESRCHVIDNRYWNDQRDEYRNNRVQVEKLLNTVEQIQRENGGRYYTFEMLQKIQKKTGVIAWFRGFAGNVILFLCEQFFSFIYWFRSLFHIR